MVISMGREISVPQGSDSNPQAISQVSTRGQAGKAFPPQVIKVSNNVVFYLSVIVEDNIHSVSYLAGWLVRSGR